MNIVVMRLLYELTISINAYMHISVLFIFLKTKMIICGSYAVFKPIEAVFVYLCICSKPLESISISISIRLRCRLRLDNCNILILLFLFKNITYFLPLQQIKMFAISLLVTQHAVFKSNQIKSNFICMAPFIL